MRYRGFNNDLCVFRIKFLFLDVTDCPLVGAGGCDGRCDTCKCSQQVKLIYRILIILNSRAECYVFNIEHRPILFSSKVQSVLVYIGIHVDVDFYSFRVMFPDLVLN